MFPKPRYFLAVEKLTFLDLGLDQFSKIKLGLVHGKMNPEEKEKVISQFNKNRINILISTTVVEVGLDVPNATIMLVEHAERFGLTQLHQLRGRVGRGERDSFCILMHSNALTELAEQRLNIISSTTDGFIIAEEDLTLRGPGDILGLSQTGQPSFNFYDLLADEKLQSEANELALEIVKMPIETQQKIVKRWF